MIWEMNVKRSFMTSVTFQNDVSTQISNAVFERIAVHIFDDCTVSPSVNVEKKTKHVVCVDYFAEKPVFRFLFHDSAEHRFFIFEAHSDVIVQQTYRTVVDFMHFFYGN